MQLAAVANGRWQMHEESGRWDEVSEAWKNTSDQEKVRFLAILGTLALSIGLVLLVILGTLALGIGLVGIIEGNLGVGVLFGLSGFLMLSLAIAIWRKRKSKKE